VSADQTSGEDNTPPSVPATDSSPRRIDSSEILGGEREVIIQHGTEQYRLRLTKAGKLILNK
jgi:hemin uptake protein HemP